MFPHTTDLLIVKMASSIHELGIDVLRKPIMRHIVLTCMEGVGLRCRILCYIVGMSSQDLGAIRATNCFKNGWALRHPKQTLLSPIIVGRVVCSTPLKLALSQRWSNTPHDLTSQTEFQDEQYNEHVRMLELLMENRNKIEEAVSRLYKHEGLWATSGGFCYPLSAAEIATRSFTE